MAQPAQQDEFPILGIDYIEMCVGSAKHIAYYLCNAFGFSVIAYRGLETGSQREVSYVLAQGDIRFVVTGSLQPGSLVGHSVAHHGDFVADIALRVPDACVAYDTAMQRGAIDFAEPRLYADGYGSFVISAIKTYGEVIHSLVERKEYTGIFAPGYVPLNKDASSGVGLHTIDHIVGNVPLGQMNIWAEYYARVMGFANLVHFTDSQISTEYTALMSKVMWDGKGKVKFPINEPALGKRKSQIDEYLEFHGGAGVQHIALETDNIVHTVSQLRLRGVEFLSIPQTYYSDSLRARFRDVRTVDIDALADLGILADRDEEGYLLQIFTKPVVDRPTLFFEIIERQGSRGFGIGNFKALFEAIEREQGERGTL